MPWSCVCACFVAILFVPLCFRHCQSLYDCPVFYWSVLVSQLFFHCPPFAGAFHCLAPGLQLVQPLRQLLAALLARGNSTELYWTWLGLGDDVCPGFRRDRGMNAVHFISDDSELYLATLLDKLHMAAELCSVCKCVTVYFGVLRSTLIWAGPVRVRVLPYSSTEPGMCRCHCFCYVHQPSSVHS